MAFPQISTPEQQREWKAKGLEIEETTGMPFGTVLRNGDGNYVVVERGGLKPVSAAIATQIIKGFKRVGSY